MAPSEAREYCDWLEGADAPKLPSTHYSVCALGDRQERFSKLGAIYRDSASRILSRRVLPDSGSVQLCPAPCMMIDAPPWLAGFPLRRVQENEQLSGSVCAVHTHTSAPAGRAWTPDLQSWAASLLWGGKT